MVKVVMLKSLVGLATALYWMGNLPTAWANIDIDKSNVTSPVSPLPVVDLNYTLQRATSYNVSPLYHASPAQLIRSFWLSRQPTVTIASWTSATVKVQPDNCALQLLLRRPRTALYNRAGLTDDVIKASLQDAPCWAYSLLTTGKHFLHGSLSLISLRHYIQLVKQIRFTRTVLHLLRFLCLAFRQQDLQKQKIVFFLMSWFPRPSFRSKPSGASDLLFWSGFTEVASRLVIRPSIHPRTS